MHNVKKLYLIIALNFFVLSFLFLQGCDENNPLDPQVLTARLTIINACPDSPNFDVYINNTLVGSNFTYLSTTNYKDVTGDAVSRVTFYQAGTVLRIDTSIYFQKDKYYTLMAFDSLQIIQPLILTDNLTPPGSANANIRFIHLVPNGVSYDAGASGKSHWFPFYSFSQASDFRAVTAGTYDLQLYFAGTSIVVANLNSQELAQGKIYTMIARGFVGATGNEALGITLIKNN